MVWALQAEQFMQSGPSDDAVDRKAGVALELGQRVGGVVTEDAVDAAGVEPKCAQPLLEVGDVVTPQHRSPAVEEAVAQQEACFDERIPGLFAANPVDTEPSQALEGLDRRPSGRTKDAIGVDCDAGKHSGEPVLDVGNGFPAIADREGEDQR